MITVLKVNYKELWQHTTRELWLVIRHQESSLEEEPCHLHLAGVWELINQLLECSRQAAQRESPEAEHRAAQRGHGNKGRCGGDKETGAASAGDEAYERGGTHVKLCPR